MASCRRVLVVDGLTETEQVLKAVLEPRGLRVDRMRATNSPPPAPPETPHLLVLHEEEAPPAGEWNEVPRIIIGKLYSGHTPRTRDASHYLPHPFEYGDLIAAIERLLEPTEPVAS